MSDPTTLPPKPASPMEELLGPYEAGSDVLRQAIKGLEREDLLARPVPGMWSIQEVVLHLMDTELVLTDRAKRIIAEENPPLLAFDENRWAKSLHYEEWSADDAVTVVGLIRRNFAKALRRLPPEAFERRGTHSQAGEQSLGQVLRKAVTHLEHHLKFIIDKREKLGKIMW